MNNAIKIALAFFITVFTTCQKTELNIEAHDCIIDVIQNIMDNPVTNPPTRIEKWEVDDTIYYYVTSDCCDQFNYLYDPQCNEICAPDGGFSGSGDGNCPEPGKNMCSVQKSLKSAQEKMGEQNKKDIEKEMLVIMKQILELSKDEEKLFVETSHSSDYSIRQREIAEKQGEIISNFQRTTSNIVELSKKTW